VSSVSTPAGPLLALLALVLLGSGPVAADKTDGADFLERRAEIHALAEGGGPSAIEQLAARLELEPEPELRRIVQDSLLRVALDPEQAADLLAHSEIEAARAFAAHSLGHRGGAVASAALLLATRDPSAAVRREVYEGLVTSGDRAAIPELVKAAVRERSPALRELAEESARRLAELPVRPREVPVAISLLEGGSPDDQLWAVKLLGQSGDWRALQALQRAATAQSLELRCEAIRALGSLGDHRAIPLLHELAGSTRGRTRHHVIGALALLSSESSLEHLAPLVEDPDPGTRVLAIRALSNLPLPQTPQHLLVALRDPEEPVRVEAVHALGRLGGPVSSQGLAGALSDPSPFVRAEAARLLAELGGERAVAALVAALDDRDPLVRLTAADGLATLGAEQAIPALERLVQRSREDEEREAYADALQRLQGSSPDQP